ncbi:hypothetical protein GLOIN_2v1788170 [Rhizophagus clarus]|uniref:Uncharacterized protein n=1 Tax=Rhizophagus clarus TaxID=94130 RepID=A0A8H3QJ12_9GLOM|nr:hypothetical protein GLOIN_2v1788170 [Rhizophagus clarus]
MLCRNKVNGEDITSIKQFTSVFEKVNDNDKAFKHCMEDIILKLLNVEIMTNINKFCRKMFPVKMQQVEYAQLKSAFQTNKKKRTADQAFGNDYFDYIYSIVITGTEWECLISSDFIKYIFSSKLHYQSDNRNCEMIWAEEKLYIWLIEQKKQELAVIYAILRIKMQEILKELEMIILYSDSVKDFKISSQWIFFL